MNIGIILIFIFLVVVSVIAWKLAHIKKYGHEDARLPGNSVASSEKEKITRSKEYRLLINKPYSMQCKSEVFSQAELEIIKKYGSWLSALASNTINPETQEQKLFIEECQYFRKLETKEMLNYFSDRKDSGSIQAVWFKYLCRIKFERENPTIINGETIVNWGWQGPPIESGSRVFFSK